MRISIRNLCLLLLSAVSAAAISGCTSTKMYYRTYYQDASCRYFYIDGVTGQRVYEGASSKGARFCGVGRSWCTDANGRLYYKDSFGNVIYKPHCSR